MAKYGEIKRISEDQWPRIYRYPGYNGIRLAEIILQKHIPSHLVIMGQRILISYEGQPITCYACNEPGHQFHDCPYKKPTMTNRMEKNKNTWATVVTRRTIQRDTMDEDENEEETIPTTDVKNKEDDTHLME